MERTTCYKLCYALGVSEKELKMDFPVEHRVVCDGTAFMPGNALKLYRTLSALYFQVMPNYPVYADHQQFERRIKECFVPYIIDGVYDPISARGGTTLLTFMNQVIAEHNSLCRRAYQELETALPYDLFCTITLLPELDSKRAAQITFLMSKTNHAYGLYFYGHELLNVSLGSMLQDDLSLRDRLSLFTGNRVGSLHDRSEMSLLVDRYIREVFLTVPELESIEGLTFMSVNGIRELELVSLVKMITGRGIKLRELLGPEELVDGTTCLMSNSKWVAANARDYPKVNFAVMLPVESKYYRQWRRRTLPNVYLVSQR